MTAVAYAMSDFAAVRVPEDQGGCGEQHAAVTGDDGLPRVECDTCAPLLIARHYGFSAKPEGVPRTPDEVACAEYQKQQADSANRELDSAMRRDWMAGQATRPPSLMEQIRSASEEEKAALRELLGTGTPARKTTPRTRGKASA